METAPVGRRVMAEWAMRAVGVALVANILIRPVLADESRLLTPRVRSTDPHLAAVLAEAEWRSATLRDLIHAIEATDGIVYIEPGRCPHGVRACLLMAVVAIPRYRMLRVTVDPRARGSDLMGSLGHELQHAIELLSNPAVTTGEAAYMFFSRFAATDAQTFETEAAIRVGHLVGKEVDSSRRTGGKAPQTTASLIGDRAARCRLEVARGQFESCGK